MIRSWLVPVLLAGTLAACASNAVNPGIVNTSASSSAPNSGAPVGATGRVVAVNEIALRGAPGGPRSGGGGMMTGGMLGGAGGGIIGAAISNTLGGALIGVVLGAVGGAIAGTIADNHGGSGPGIEVTVQTDQGQTVTVAQRDDGDVQLGDRVQIVQDGRGVAKVVRDQSRTYDPNNGQQPQYNGPQGNGPPPSYGTSQNNGPQPGYGTSQYSGGYGAPPNPYRRPQRVSNTGPYYPPNQGGAPLPQDDPRLGTLN